MVTLITKENQNICPELIIGGEKFTEEVFFPKVRNLNRLDPEHKKIVEWTRTEKYDGQNIGCQKVGEYLIFYSRNGILLLQYFNKDLRSAWDKIDWNEVFNSLGEKDILYFEALGQHRDFDYRDILENGYGFMTFALRKADGRILDPSKMQDVGIMKVPIIERGRLPKVEDLRKMLDSGREGYVFTTYDEDGQYIAYKAKRRELLEEVPEEVEEAILRGKDRPAVKIARIICTPTKVKHILQKLKDGEIQVRGSGIDETGRWDGSNSILPTLIKTVQDDCWQESKDKVLLLQEKIGNVSGRDINKSIEDVVRKSFFDII